MFKNRYIKVNVIQFVTVIIGIILFIVDIKYGLSYCIGIIVYKANYFRIDKVSDILLGGYGGKKLSFITFLLSYITIGLIMVLCVQFNNILNIWCFVAALIYCKFCLMIDMFKKGESNGNNNSK